MNARKRLAALIAAAAASAREGLRYRGDVLGSVAFLGVLVFIFSRLWQTVAGDDGQVGTYVVSQLVLYLVLTEVVVLSPGNAHARIARDVRSGELAVHLLRPVRYAHWELGRCLGVVAVRAVAFLVTGSAVAWLLVGWPHLDPIGVLVGVGLLLPAALLLETTWRVLVGLLSFWFEDSSPFYWIWQKCTFILGGLMLPLDLYPEWMQPVMAVLPFQALLYGPARTVVAFDPDVASRAALSLVAWSVVGHALLLLVERRACARLQVNGG